MLSLWCPISALTLAGRGGLLFRFAGSVLLQGGRGAADRHRCVWTALTVIRPHWVCPVQGCLCFPRLHCSGSRLLYMERALRCVRFQFLGTPQKRGFGCTCVLCLPGPERSGSQELDGRTLPGCGAPSPLLGPASVSARPTVGCQRLEFVLRSWPLAATLPAAGVDHPESQGVFG